MQQDDFSLLLSSAERWFANHAPLSERAAHFRDGHHEPAGAWADFARMGWTALTLPEAQGGFGANTAQTFALLHRAGADARPEPLGLHLLLAPALARALPDTVQTLTDGRMRLALAEPPQGGALTWNGRQIIGRAPLIDGFEHATHVLVPLGDGTDTLLLIDLASTHIQRTPARLVDGRVTAHLAFDGVPAHAIEGAALARDLAAAACVPDAGGVFEAGFTMTLDYLKQRIQFGKPLATQQAIQHRMAEVFCDLQQHLALVGRLAAEIDAAPTGPWLTLPVAKSFVGRRVLRGVGALVQLSGGIAVTEQYRLTHLYRRLHVAAQLHGAAEAQLARIDVRATLRPA